MDSLRFAPFALIALTAGCSGGDVEVTTPGGAGTAGGSNRGSYAPDASSAQNSDQLFARGQMAAATGRSAEAAELFRQALALAPEDVDLRAALGRLLVPMSYTVVLGSSTREVDVLDEAIEHLKKAVELAPEDAEHAYWAGRALDLRGKDVEAAAMLERAIELDPEYGEAYKRLGLIHVEAGEVQQAITNFERAAELLDDPGVPFQLGNLTLEDDPERAKGYYEKAIEMDPTVPRFYHGLSMALAQLGEVEAAAEAKRLLDVYQGHENTLKALVRLAGENLDDPAAQFTAGEMYFLLGKYDEALTMMRRAISLDPANPSAHYYCGLISLGNGDNEAARNHLEECLFYEPNNIGAQIELVRVHHAEGNVDRTNELVELIGERVSEPAARNAFAEVLIEIGRADDAVPQLKKVLDGEPDNEDAKALLALATK